MPYDVIGAVLGLVALIAAGIARQSLNKAARFERSLDEMREEMSGLRSDIQDLRAALQREKKKRSG